MPNDGTALQAPINSNTGGFTPLSTTDTSLNTTVPTFAPKGQTSTSAPADTPVPVVPPPPPPTKTPPPTGITPKAGYEVDPNNPNGVIPIPPVQTPVVSSSTASTAVGNMQNTVTSAQAAIDAANQARIANQGKPGYDVFGNPVSGTPLATGGANATNTTTTPLTPEQQIASQPSDGFKFIYDAQGQQHSIPITDPTPSGYTDTKPGTEPTTPVTGTAQTNMYLYKQYSDGTYGRYSIDASGNFVYQGVATQVDFQGAQAFQNASTALQTVMNGGTLPLTAAQQSDVAALQATWNTQIQQQETMNQNNMGGLALLENLRGISGDAVGMTAASQQITAGSQAVADLQAKAAEAIATMKDGFETNNVATIKSAYDSYTTSQAEMTAQIKAMQATLDAAQKVQNVQIDQASIDSAVGAQIAKGVTDPNAILTALTTAGMTVTAKQVADTLASLSPNATAMTALMKTVASNGAPASVIKAIGAARDLNAAYIAAGVYGDGGSGIIGQYNLYRTSGGTQSLNDWLTAYHTAISAGTTLGKNATTNTTDSSFGNVTIPQDMGTSTNQLAYQNNNPGNLRLSQPPQTGATQGTGGFAKFDTPADGYAALIADVTAKVTAHPGNTILDMIAGGTDATTGKTFDGYAPASDGNDPASYAATVAKALGVTPNTQLSQIDPSKLAAAVAMVESGTTTTPGWNPNDASPPPSGDAGNTVFGITGRTPNDIYNDSLKLALDKTYTAQKALGGLSGSSGQGLALKNAIENKTAALVTASGVNPVLLQQQFAANSGAINKTMTTIASVQSSVDSADSQVSQVMSIFKNAGINPNDSTFLNTKLNQLSLQLSNSGDLRAYQAAVFEIGNTYSQVFARGGQRSVEGNQTSADILSGNITLGDFQKVTAELQAQGQTVVQANINEVSSVASGSGSDQVAKFLTFIANQQQPDTANQTVIQNEQQQESQLTAKLQSIATSSPAEYKAASGMFTTINPSTGQPYTAADVLQAFPELAQ